MPGIPLRCYVLFYAFGLAAVFTQTVVYSALVTAQQPAVQQPTVIWQESFEGPQPAQFALTYHNARQVSVSFAGTTAELAARGDHSYKIAATLAAGNYAYWITKVDIPFSHPLKIRGKVRYEVEVDVQIGYCFHNLATGAGSLWRQGVKGQRFGTGLASVGVLRPRSAQVGPGVAAAGSWSLCFSQCLAQALSAGPHPRRPGFASWEPSCRMPETGPESRPLCG